MGVTNRNKSVLRWHSCKAVAILACASPAVFCTAARADLIFIDTDSPVPRNLASTQTATSQLITTFDSTADESVFTGNYELSALVSDGGDWLNEGRHALLDGTSRKIGSHELYDDSGSGSVSLESWPEGESDHVMLYDIPRSIGDNRSLLTGRDQVIVRDGTGGKGAISVVPPVPLPGATLLGTFGLAIIGLGRKKLAT
jgi:hypothetical protein